MTDLAHKGFKKAKVDKSRQLAYEVISAVNHREAYSNLLLPKRLTESDLDLRDKGFVTEIVYGTLRMQELYDLIIAANSTRDYKDVDAAIKDILRVGSHQLFSMRVSTHAAVDSTVDLARSLLGESQGSFVNAIMRKLSSRTLEEWQSEIIQDSDPVARLAQTYSHPEWIVSSYLDILKNSELVEAELISNNTPALPTLVAWPQTSSQEDLVNLGAEATLYSSYGARFDGSPASLDIIQSRSAGVQDEGSQLVASIFHQATGARKSILDLCAGPGGKAALLSRFAAMHSQEFMANEISEPRALLVKQVVGESPVRTGDARTISDTNLTFDAILADVPCTGIGALRRRPEVRFRRTLSDLAPLIALQQEIIDSAIAVLNIGGLFGYATCSPHFAETSGQVRYLLKKYPNMKHIDVTPYLPSNLSDAVRDGALSLWGHKHNTDSMFLALFERTE